MSDRITSKRLDSLCDTLNRVLGTSMEPSTRENGRYKANVGCYHIDASCGGYALYRITNEGGACSDVLHVGHTSPRALYDVIQGLLVGVSLGREKAEV